MKKSKTKLFLGIIAALFLFSCEDHLEKPSINPIDTYWNFRVWDPNFKQYYLQKNILYFSHFSVTDNDSSFTMKISLNHTFDLDYVIKEKINNEWMEIDYGGEFISVLKKGVLDEKEAAEIIRTDHVFGIFEGEKLIDEVIT